MAIREEAQRLFDVLSEEDLKEFLENFEDRFQRFEINARILTVTQKVIREKKSKGIIGKIVKGAPKMSQIQIWEFFQDPPPSQSVESTEKRKTIKETKPRQFRVVKEFTYEGSLSSLVVVPGTTKGAVFYMKSSDKIIKWREETRSATESKGEFVPEVFVEGLSFIDLMFATSDGSLFCIGRKNDSTIIKFSPTGERIEKKFNTDVLGDLFPLCIQGKDFVGIERGDSFIVLRAEDLSEFDRVPAVTGGERPTRPFISRDKFMTNEAVREEESLVWRYVPPLHGDGHGKIEKLAIGSSNAIDTIGDELVFEGIVEVHGVDIYAPTETRGDEGLILYNKVQTLDIEVPSDETDMFSPAENLLFIQQELWKRSERSFKKIQHFSVDGLYVFPPSEFAKGKMVDFLVSLQLPVPRDILGIFVGFSVVKIR